MKKVLTIILLSLTLMITTTYLSVYAETQRVWGKCSGYGYTDGVKTYNITTETETVSAILAEELVLNLGTTAWFTITDGVITAIETIPEFEYEIAYMSSASNGLDNINITLCNNECTTLSLSARVKINGTTYQTSNDAATIIDTLNNLKGFVGYQFESDIDDETQEIITTEYVNNIVTVSSKQTLNDIKQADFSNLCYKITNDTQFYFVSEDNTYYQVGTLPTSDDYYYSFEVMSYDKDYNARAIKVSKIYTSDIAFYLGSYYTSADGYMLKAVNKNGESVDLLIDESVSESGILDTLSAGILEYNCTLDNVVTSISALSEFDTFSDLEVTDNKVGEYNISDIISFDVVDTGNEERHNWVYSKAEFSDSYTYNGTVYITSNGKTVLWIQSKSEAAGLPVVEFSARNRESGELRVRADIDLNGYAGTGNVYLAVYKGNRLSDVFTYDLSNSNDISEEDYEISETVNDSEDTEFSQYTVKGFIWGTNLSPLLPAVDVQIK